MGDYLRDTAARAADDRRVATLDAAYSRGFRDALRALSVGAFSGRHADDTLTVAELRTLIAAATRGHESPRSQL